MTQWLKPHASLTSSNAWRRVPTIESLEERQVLDGIPIITEFMAKNDGVLLDGDGNDFDWIEIHNAGDTAVDLAGYRLTDDPGNPSKWVFPSVVVDAGGYLVVFASSQATNNYVDAAGYLHTNFALSAGGETIALITPNGTLVSNYGTTGRDYPAQTSNVSYGVAQQDSVSGKIGYMASPTPGDENVGDELVFTGVLEERATISADAGFYDEPFFVTLSSQSPDVELRYTTDGSQPTATTGFVYQEPIRIDTTSTLRVAVFKEDFIPSPVETRSYIFLQDMIQQSNDQPHLPSRWEQPGSSYDADYEMDPVVVNDPAYHDEIVDGLRSIRTMSIVMDPQDFLGTGGIYLNTNRRGIESERPVSVEIINPDGTLAVQVDAGLRNQGGNTRNFSVTLKQSFRLVFRARYGSAKLEYPLFPDSPVDRLDNIVLHAGKLQDDPQLLRNSFARDTNRAMGNLDAHSTYVHLYLNGLYWGLYNPYERPDAGFAQEYIGGSDEDYDAILNHAEVHDGDLVRYEEMLQRILAQPATQEAYEELERYVDLNSLFDVLLINLYMAHQEEEMRAIGSRVGDPNFRFLVHDVDEKGMMHVGGNRRGEVFMPPGVYHALTTHPELRMRYADRIHKHLFNDGALTPREAAQRWEARYGEIYSAVIAESARWGDTHWRTTWPDEPSRRDVELAEEEVFLREEFFPRRTGVFLNRLRSAGIYPQIDAPVWDQPDGAITSAIELTMSHANSTGTILYSLDGTDPRQYGDEIAANALTYDGSPIPIHGNTLVKARVFADGQWSALNEGEFFVAAADSPFHLRISEINHHPHQANAVPGLQEADVDSGQFKYIEFANTSTETIDLSGVRLSGAAIFTFPVGTMLRRDQRLVVVNNRTAFESRYGSGLNVAGEFEFEALSNAYGVLKLHDAAGRAIHSVTFGSREPWSQRAVGDGSSLELIDLETGADPSDWRASTEFGGSPGYLAPDSRSSIVLNEVLPHPAPPAVDMVELYNTRSIPVDVGHWYLSNSDGQYSQVSEGTAISGHGYHVLNEAELAFDVSAHGDLLRLIEADALGKPLRFVDQVRFGPSPENVSLGPGPLADESWFPLTEPTFGRENSGLTIGDVIITEVHYAPLDPDDGGRWKPEDVEYIELHNRTDSRQDLSAWRLTGGIEFTLPSGTVLDAQESLLVVPFDPTDERRVELFRVAHAVDSSISWAGPYVGVLEDEADVVRLERPEVPFVNDPMFTPYVYVDEVRYQGVAPWPLEAAGTGASLSRVAAESFGNSPASWSARNISPGAADFILRIEGDTNEDGRFDQLDLQHALQAGKYRTGQPATWQEGDWNGDGVFDSADLVIAFRGGEFDKLP